MTHVEWMRHALQLAERGRGSTSPNPVVGCVIVRDGHAISEGYHAKYGGPHAEAAALSSATASVVGATLYCTLEPCTYFGNTPPCADAVIAAGISTVVIAMRDPNPRINGQGVQRMRDAGIDVIEGILEDECRWANRGFIMAQRAQRPWIIGKVAQTLDGLVNAEGTRPRAITGDAARAAVHATRAAVDAVLVGSRTVLADDPLLTVRDSAGRTPIRVIVDAELETPPTAQVFSTQAHAPVIMLVAEDQLDTPRARELQAVGAQLLGVPRDGKGLSLARALSTLYSENKVLSVLLESGGELLRAFAEHVLVDELHLYIAPTTAGGGTTWTGATGINGTEEQWTLDSVASYGNDARICAVRVASKEMIS
jgi:diaminohydroxyphosphoribosylaminopyrimidine deaminase/5-amino-6-(5-phosphoribosylamino)uracil reductase